jgi:outer membrane protein TolC
MRCDTSRKGESFLKKQMLSAAVILAFLIFCSSAHAADPLTLDEAKYLAIQNSREMSKSKISTDSARYKFYQAEKEYEDSGYPSSWDSYAGIMADLTLLYNYKATLDPIEDAAEIAKTNSEIDLKKRAADQALDQYYADLKQRDSIQKQMEDAEDTYKDAKLSQEEFEEELKYNIEQIYTNILLQENKVPILQRDMEYKKLLLEIEKKRLGLGVSSQETVDSFEEDCTNADHSLIEAKNFLKNTKGNLNDMMGQDYDEEISLKPIQIDLFEEMPTYDQIISKVLKESTKLSQIQRDIEKKENDLEDDLSDYTNDYKPYQEELVRLEIKEMELQLQDEKYRLKQNVNNLLASLDTKQKKYQLSQIETNNAKKQYNWDKKRYEIGQLPKLKLMQSELAYLNAKQGFLATEYDLFLTKRAIDLVDKGIVV